MGSRLKTIRHKESHASAELTKVTQCIEADMWADTSVPLASRHDRIRHVSYTIIHGCRLTPLLLASNFLDELHQIRMFYSQLKSLDPQPRICAHFLSNSGTEKVTPHKTQSQLICLTFYLFLMRGREGTYF